MTENAPTCEICSGPVHGGFRDIREVWPTKSDKGVWWSNWEAASPWSHRCIKHERNGKVIRLKPEVVTRYFHAIEAGIDITDIAMEWNDADQSYIPLSILSRLERGRQCLSGS